MMTFVSFPARTVFGAIASLVLGGACLIGAAGPAAAATADGASARVVFVGDLNLQSASGRAAYEARVKNAAHAVCATDRKDIASQAAESRCVKSAVANARTVTNVTAS